MSRFPGSSFDVAEQPRRSGFEGQEKASMAFAGETPWHGLGQKLSPDADLETWQKEADLNWEVIPAPVRYGVPTKVEGEVEYRDFAGRTVLVRSDTGMPLAVVTNKYHPVQPKQVMEFFRDFTEALGAFKMETAGNLRGGSKVWALARAEDDLVLDKEDVIQRYLLLATSYDLTIKTIAQQTSTRVVCQNTLAAATRAGEAGQELRITVSHRTKFDGDKVKQKMMLDDQWKTFGEAVRRLADKRISEGRAEELIKDIFYPREVKEKVEHSEKSVSKKIDEIKEYMLTAPGQKISTADGTVWGVVNAITYFVDHKAKSKSRDLRLDKAFFGDGNALKTRAFRKGMDLVGV